MTTQLLAFRYIYGFYSTLIVNARICVRFWRLAVKCCECVILCVATIHKIKRVALVSSHEAQCHSTVKHHSTKTRFSGETLFEDLGG